ncbi:MAG: hypothetical protein WAV20_03160, partial [Blastocatellia bacterium]
MLNHQAPWQPPILPRHSLLHPVLIVILFIFIISPAQAVDAWKPNDLDKKIQELIRASGAETVAVGYHD